jgi:tetratricopeptide (TPR) repeat protein
MIRDDDERWHRDAPGQNLLNLQLKAAKRGDLLYGFYDELIQYNRVLLIKAECHQGLQEWKKAMDLYEQMLAMVGHRKDLLSIQATLESTVGLTRCQYKIGDYEQCIATSKTAAIAMRPYFPGRHKYKALSEKALGRYDESTNTMIEACIYETPWDVENKKIQLDLYDQLIADTAKVSVLALQTSPLQTLSENVVPEASVKKQIEDGFEAEQEKA